MTTNRKSRSPQDFAGKTCGECALSYDLHCTGADGKPFLCRCKHRKEGGRFSIFISDRACDKFTEKK